MTTLAETYAAEQARNAVPTVITGIRRAKHLATATMAAGMAASYTHQAHNLATLGVDTPAAWILPGINDLTLFTGVTIAMVPCMPRPVVRTAIAITALCGATSIAINSLGTGPAIVGLLYALIVGTGVAMKILIPFMKPVFAALQATETQAAAQAPTGRRLDPEVARARAAKAAATRRAKQAEAEKAAEIRKAKAAATRRANKAAQATFDAQLQAIADGALGVNAPTSPAPYGTR